MSAFNSYQSPFSWRYGSQEMRQIWSETNKRRLWRSLWVALAETQMGYGLVTQAQLADLQAHADQVDIERALQIEAEIHHDLMAELKTFAEQSPIGGGILHLGATSMDIEDNADAIRLRDSLDLILTSLQGLLLALSEQIETWADIPAIGYTHLQPAEPLTLGYRFAFYAQDLLADWRMLKLARHNLCGKGFKGAVGTAAAYQELVGEQNLAGFETQMSAAIDLPFFPVTGQTYPRKQDYWIVSALAGLGATLYKLAFDIRFLQSPQVGEISEPFAEKQVGSSAMPFKRNPINSEKIDSLARALAQMPLLAWQNAANCLLERTLDDSANRRSMLPEAFLTCDELLRTTQRILQKIDVRRDVIAANLSRYAPFAASERLLMALAKSGADRQEMHEILRQQSLSTWDTIRAGGQNDLVERLAADARLSRFLEPDQIRTLMSAEGHTGAAALWAVEMAQQIRGELNQS